MNTYKRHRFSSSIISYAARIYYRFNLIFRDVEDSLAERGITFSYESIRLWCTRFGRLYARRLKRNHRGFGDTFYLDEVVDVYLQDRSDCAAAKRFLKRVVKRSGAKPRP
jgi:putative transposase